ncbi:MAG: hypothetical protein R3F46_01220 [bacterium]
MRLRAEIPDARQQWGDPDDPGNPLRLLSELKLTALVAGKQVLFRGRVAELDPAEGPDPPARAGLELPAGGDGM